MCEQSTKSVNRKVRTKKLTLEDFMMTGIGQTLSEVRKDYRLYLKTGHI